MELLYQSKYYKLYQCDQQRCFHFEAEHKQVTMSFCQLLKFRNSLNAIDLSTHFYADENKNGLEILTFCNRQHLMVLNTYEVIDLKELFFGAFAILQGPCISQLAV